MARNWTPEQSEAIYDRGGTLLVSAAAGSGKTAVLVERVFQHMLDPVHPIDADRMLVVTFSNAAAEEMLQRINAKLSELEQDPNFADLAARQLMLMDQANISTIHAFCLKVLRQNFQAVEISSDFRIADDSEIRILKGQAIQEILNRYYLEKSDTFLDLVELLSSFRDDTALIQTIFSIYDFMRSHPFYRSWPQQMLKLYDEKQDLTRSPWIEILLRYAQEALEEAEHKSEQLFQLLDLNPEPGASYRGLFSIECDRVKELLRLCRRRDFSLLHYELQMFSYDKLPSVKGEDKGWKGLLKKIRDEQKKIIAELQEKICSDLDAFRRDLKDLKPKIEMLFQITLDFDQCLEKLKQQRNCLDFSDLEQKTLELLVELLPNGEIRFTETAQRLSEQYEEILIDEYQDTNAAQDMIFRAISRNGKNLFMVGDVKQSIYQFRQAMPELFLAKRNHYAPYDKQHYPACISLSRNFRSRSEVTEFANVLFRQLMSPTVGGLDYDKTEELVCATPFEEQAGCESEIDLIETSDAMSSSDVLQARHIGSRIMAYKRNFQITQSDGSKRPAKYSDFCILMRSPRNSAAIYAQELAEMGIPVWYDNAEGYVDSPEIMGVLSFLRVISNPTSDVDLLAALYGPVFGMSSDEIVMLRKESSEEHLIQSIVLTAQGRGQNSALRDRCQAVLDRLADLRRASAQLPVCELIQYFYDTTDYPILIRTTYQDESRNANLRLLKIYAQQYEQNANGSLSGFLRYIDRLVEQGGDLSSASALSEHADVVRIMSIHRSKGLEIPICFVADLNRLFNKTDLRQKTILHSRLGFACVRRDKNARKQFLTLPLNAVRIACEQSMLSEELRMLYVALTRAKEKLILVIAGKKLKEKLLDYCDQRSEKVPPYMLQRAQSLAQWILLAIATSKQADSLLNLFVTGFDAHCTLNMIDEVAEPEAETQEIDLSLFGENRDAKPYYDCLKQNLEYRYPHVAATKTPAKMGVSEVAKGKTSLELKRPRFLEESPKELTPAERGTAIHAFFQFADYHLAQQDPQKEVERLVQNAYITPQQGACIKPEQIEAFFRSEAAQRIFSAQQVWRELRFLFSAPIDLLENPNEAAKRITATESEEDCVMLQGIADCVYCIDGVYTVLDYKSDFVKTPEQLIERYATQLLFYRQALSQVFSVPADQIRCEIYSFALNELITVW